MATYKKNCMKHINYRSLICFLSSRKPTAAMRCMCPLYDPNRQLWIELAPLSMPRINHGVLSAGTVLWQIFLKHQIK